MGPDDEEVDVDAAVDEVRTVTIPETTLRITQHDAREIDALRATRERMREQMGTELAGDIRPPQWITQHIPEWPPQWRIVERELPGVINTGRGPALFVNPNAIARVNLDINGDLTVRPPVPAQSRHDTVSTAHKCGCGGRREPVLRDKLMWGIHVKDLPLWVCERCGSDFIFVREPKRRLIYSYNNVSPLMNAKRELTYNEFLEILYSDSTGEKTNEQL